MRWRLGEANQFGGHITDLGGERKQRVFRWKICGVKKNEGMELREKEEGVRIYKWERVIES